MIALRDAAEAKLKFASPTQGLEIQLVLEGSNKVVGGDGAFLQPVLKVGALSDDRLNLGLKGRRL